MNTMTVSELREIRHKSIEAGVSAAKKALYYALLEKSRSGLEMTYEDLHLKFILEHDLKLGEWEA